MSATSTQGQLDLYLCEIGRVPLLTAAEERALGRRVRDHGDPEARDRMIRANLRLVVNLAAGYTDRGLDLSDLIAEGNLGLIRAVESYDPDRGTRFGTWAAWWIKQAIGRALIDTAPTVRVSAYMVGQITQWKRTTKSLQEELGRMPTDAEVAEPMGLPVKKIQRIRRTIKGMQPVRQSDGSETGDLYEQVEDARGPQPEEPAAWADQVAALRTLLDALDEREATILRKRFGLDGEEARTLSEIGDEIGMTREGVRKIERAALQKLQARFGRNRILDGVETEAADNGKTARRSRQSHQRTRQTAANGRRPARNGTGRKSPANSHTGKAQQLQPAA